MSKGSVQVDEVHDDGRAEILATYPTDAGGVVARCLAPPAAAGTSIVYQKHMTHHMLPGFGLDWMRACRNAFLIRDPVEVLASYSVKRGEVELADVGFVQQSDIFNREADRLGHAPPVVEGIDVLRDPAKLGPEIRAHLEAETAYAEATLAPLAGLREKLFSEMKARLKPEASANSTRTAMR